MHNAKKHNGCNIAELTDTIFLHWALSNTILGAGSMNNLKPMTEINKVDWS